MYLTLHNRQYEGNIEKISQIYHATDYLYESYISEFQNILKEIDEDFSEEELDGIIADVRNIRDVACNQLIIYNFSDRH